MSRVYEYNARECNGARFIGLLADTRPSASNCRTITSGRALFLSGWRVFSRRAISRRGLKLEARVFAPDAEGKLTRRKKRRVTIELVIARASSTTHVPIARL